LLEHVGSKLIEGQYVSNEKKANRQGGPPPGPAPTEVKTTLEPTLFDIDLTINKVNILSLTST